MMTVHIVLPNDIDDPTNPSGGNLYDRRICGGLAASGWTVREHAVAGTWPRPGATDRAGLARVLATLPDDSLVMLDGLVASTVPDVLVPPARRLRMVILVHLPVGDESVEFRAQERDVLSAAVAVVTTSLWGRQRLLDLYDLPADRVHIAPPGVDTARPVIGSDAGTRLLCVAAVAPHKGHDVLVAALAAIADRPWTCVCVGPLDRDPGFVDRVRGLTEAHGIADRIAFVGPRTGADLDERYAAADLLVLPSRGETYGMVVTEALARGIPVLATAANGLPEALGRAPDGRRPGILVPPDDPAALAGALRRWLGDPMVRRGLRQSTLDRRDSLTGWALTTALVASALYGTVDRVGTAV